MDRTIAPLAALLLVGSASAQSVQFRIVERTNQTTVDTSDSFLELAVQARVTGGSLGAFSFDIAIAGEAENLGTLSRLRINNANHTYFTGGPWITNNTVGQGGLASPYSYLAQAQSGLNGQINASGGGFTNNPNEQEIGLVLGRAMGPPMVATPGIDPNNYGSPSTWSGYGPGATPPVGALATLSASIAGPYFGNDEFIDIYHFGYNVTDFTPRDLNFVLRNITAENFTRMTYGPGLWGAQDTTFPAGQIQGAPLTIVSPSGFVALIPAPSSAALLGLAGLIVGRRRR